MDFRSRSATFPRGVPVHELNEDDYANNVKLSSTNGVEKTRSKKRKQALRNQVEFSSSDPAAMAPPDNLNNQSKGRSAKSTSKINNKNRLPIKETKALRFFVKKNSLKQSLQLQKSQPSFPNLNESKFHLSLSKLRQMETAYFAQFLLHRVLMTPAIWNYD
jgi:hypothetical protein